MSAYDPVCTTCLRQVPECGCETDPCQSKGPCVCPPGPPGSMGPRGHQGPCGPCGPAGKQGRSGDPGPEGIPGPKGPEGPAGRDGAEGLQGPVGSTGQVGEVGPQGPEGERGLQGPRGFDGLTGDTGSRGPQGDEGQRGSQGAQGDTGEQGERGERGAQGDEGARGLQGAQGETGDTGDTGERGAVGETGPQGVVGARGAQGPAGDAGVQGEKGERGFTGSVGAQGIQGIRGLTGQTGPEGPRGLQGPAGDKGETGAQGPAGEAGGAGSRGPAGPSGIVSCEFDEDTNCYDVSAVLQDGSTKEMKLGGCVTLLACGYAGNPICATNATGTILEESSGNIKINVVWQVAGGELTSLLEFNDTIQSNSTSVSNMRFENGTFCVDVQTQGKIGYNNVFDKSNLPVTEQGCSSPIDGTLNIAGIRTGPGQPTAIDKAIGGNVTQTGFNSLGSGTYQVNSDNNSWMDDVPPGLFGGLGSNLFGSNFKGVVDTFSALQQNVTFCEQVCYYKPVEYETDLSGNLISGTGRDVEGNVVPDEQIVQL